MLKLTCVIIFFSNVKTLVPIYATILSKSFLGWFLYTLANSVWETTVIFLQFNSVILVARKWLTSALNKGKVLWKHQWQHQKHYSVNMGHLACVWTEVSPWVQACDGDEHKDITDRIIWIRQLQMSRYCKVSSLILCVQAQISARTIFNELTWSLTWHLRYPYRAAAAAVSSVTQGFDLNEQVFFWRHLKLHGRPVGLHYAASPVPVLTIHNLRGRKWVSEMHILDKNTQK